MLSCNIGNYLMKRQSERFIIILFTLSSYCLQLMEKPIVNNYYLPLINFNNIIENYYRLIQIFTVDEYN